MSVVQPAGGNSCNEELRSIGVFAGVSHRQNTRFGVLQFKVLIYIENFKMIES